MKHLLANVEGNDQPSDRNTISVPIKIRRHTVDKLKAEARRRRVRVDELPSAILNDVDY